MDTQKIHFKLKLSITTLIAVLLMGCAFAFSIGGLMAVMSSTANAANTCVEPKDKKEKDKAVDPECAKAGRVTLTDDQAKKAGLQPRSGDDIVAKTLTGVYAIASFIAVLAIVIAGIAIITADGDAAKVATARKAIIYAVVGLAIIGSAFIITGIVQGIGTR